MKHDERLVDEGAVHILLAQEYESAGPFTDELIEWARRALGIGEVLEHFGDCTKVPISCQLCAREEHQRMMRAALAAIDASGIAWVAPWEATEAMRRPRPFPTEWNEYRDAYLAEQGERK